MVMQINRIIASEIQGAQDGKQKGHCLVPLIVQRYRWVFFFENDDGKAALIRWRALYTTCCSPR